MALPKFQTDSKDFQLMQSAWASQIDPVLANPSLKSRLIKDVALVVGATKIDHKLGRTPQGWRIVDIDGVAQIYRSEDLNSLTLTLTSSAAVTVAIEVF